MPRAMTHKASQYKQMQILNDLLHNADDNTLKCF